MRKVLCGIFVALFVLLSCGVFVACGWDGVVVADAGKYVYLGGYPIGIAVKAEGLIVVRVCEVITDDGEVAPLGAFGLTAGDLVLEINGEKAVSIYQLKKAVEGAETVEIKVKRRGGEIIDIQAKPALDKTSNSKKLGIVLKEDVGGVGTMTFVTDDGVFACLGHHVYDAETRLGDSLADGEIYRTTVTDVVKGGGGKAGGLVAPLNRLADAIGDVRKNTNIGVYGNYYPKPESTKIRIAERGDAKIGKAQIFTTINGSTPLFYDVDVVKVISQDNPGEKGLVICVRDKALIAKTGGIVQGMSGSPIIQNGLLIGAVTHVFLEDSTRGYGVHSRFMYEYAMDVTSVENAIGVAA